MRCRNSFDEFVASETVLEQDAVVNGMRLHDRRVRIVASVYVAKRLFNVVWIVFWKV